MELENDLGNFQGAATICKPIVIEVLNPVESKISTVQTRPLIPIMQYKASFWRKGPFDNKIREDYDKSLFHIRTPDYWYFYTGFLPRIKEFSKKENIQLHIKEPTFNIPTVDPQLKNITLKDHQEELIHLALKYKRG